MPGSVLVDSSFFIDRLRAGDDPFAEFAAHADDTDFLTCGVVMVEVLRNVKIKKAQARLHALMSVMLYIPTTDRVWERVAALASQLDRTGHAMQVTDLTIAACALEADAAVLTFDGDFARVPGLRILRTLG